MPCDNRHILGWYRLIRELKASGVGVICVFDGAERGLAKQREGQRRRKLQRMEAARGAMEVERLRRLRRLTELFKRYQALPQDQRDLSTRTLHRIIREPLENDAIQEPPLGAAPNSELDIQQLSNEPIVPDATSSAPPNETVDSPTLLQSSESSAMQLSNGDAVFQDPISSPPGLTQEMTKIELQPQCMEPSRASFTATDDTLESGRNPQTSFRSEECSADDLNTGSSLLKDQQEFPLPSSSSDLSFDPPRTDEEVLDPQITRQRLSLQIDDSIEFPPMVISRDSLGYLFDSTDKGLSGSSIADPYDECFVDDDGPFAELCEYFDSPASLCLDAYALVNTTQPYAIEPPDDLYTEMESETYSDFDLSDADRSAVEKHVDDSSFQSDDVVQELHSLYQDYHQSIPAVMSSPLLDPSAAGSSDGGAREQYVMSKSQVQLAIDEGILWRSLVDPSAVDEADSQQRLDLLSRRSETLSKSYEKRNNPPTSKTYEESKLILQALGVPCIETAGPYEAEALAASLVHHGFADYVASEDTDVLVYEAPLLRNITNRQSPLTLLSGAEIRQVLQLDRASYVDFALLLGTDFSQRIRNLGPHRAIKLIRAHGRIEHVIANEPKFTPRLPADVYLEEVASARLVFGTLPPVPNPEVLQPMQSDEGSVAALLDKYGVYREAMVEGDFAGALDGNYFNDNPSVN
ncbi:hypothetical protein JB92DRAFT_243407 [Gautieria morchelliformis]|nr:hypothetical protein JB92DRAFT_243407 [Gautieria morchelliformis]